MELNLKNFLEKVMQEISKFFLENTIIALSERITFVSEEGL